jgi:hypothetical protein
MEPEIPSPYPQVPATCPYPHALPDDGDYTETCWRCFNVNFKIVFKTIHLYITWWIKNFDNIKVDFKKIHLYISWWIKNFDNIKADLRQFTCTSVGE